MRSLPAQRPAAKKRKATKRNPPSIAGIGADFAGLGSALSDLGRRPMGFLWLGGGAAGTMIAGGVIGAQLGRIMPEMQPGIARLVNAATYASTAVLLSRMPRDVTTRRQMLAGGLAIALWELAQPGATVPLVAKIPGVGRMIAPPNTQALARMPALQANPSAQAQAVAAAQPWYRAGGKVNPINWLAGAEEGDPVSVDGIADDDGQVYGLTDDDDAAASMAGAGTGATDDDAFPSPMSISGVGSDSAPLMTYLNGLGCAPSERGNGLTQLVRV